MNSAEHMVNLLRHDFEHLRVLVVGDIMLDRYIWGKVERISPEAPVPVLSLVRRTEVPGGAGNVAMNLAGLGVQVSLAGFRGRDTEGEELNKLLNIANIDCSGVVVSDLATTSKTRVVARQQQLVRLDVEAVTHSQSEHQLLLSRVVALAVDVDAIVISDYAKGVLKKELCRQLIDIGRERRVPVLVDPKDRNFGKYSGATTICPNLSELAAAMGLFDTDVGTLIEAAQHAVKQNSIDYLTVTMGEKGIAIVRSDSTFHSPAQASEVFDISGAGDTVIAAVAAGLASGLSPEQAVELANMAAGVVIGKLGTSAISRQELIAKLISHSQVMAREKVLEIDALLDRVTEWRRAGNKIVFTNGCFDLLHVGHVELLERCRTFGDKLIVALNGDSSVRRLKGSSRPIIQENERARMLAALVAPDVVVIFDDDDPVNLIHTIRPDVLVKGGDYSESTVLGAREVIGWGGEVKIVPMVDKISTQFIIRKITGDRTSNTEIGPAS
jgi:D-beta-D-heptose 7-phosphate kinase / D-beta-D-heptose 1-phosphate adenosyltransferase